LPWQNVFEPSFLLNIVFNFQGYFYIPLFSFICVLVQSLEIFSFEIVVTEKQNFFFTGKNTNKVKLLRSDSKILGTAGIFTENSNGRKEGLRSVYIAQVHPRRRYVFSVIECI